MTDDGKFEEFMAELTANPPQGAPFLEPALRIVLSAANGVRLWFREHGVPLHSAELIAMTRLVLERKEEMYRRERERLARGVVY